MNYYCLSGLFFVFFIIVTKIAAFQVFLILHFLSVITKLLINVSSSGCSVTR
jgi:hypothetical protein